MHSSYALSESDLFRDKGHKEYEIAVYFVSTMSYWQIGWIYGYANYT